MVWNGLKNCHLTQIHGNSVWMGAEVISRLAISLLYERQANIGMDEEY